MARYGFRIVDETTGKHLGHAVDLESPFDVGKVAADAYTVLIQREGYSPEVLAMEGQVKEDDGTMRDFTDAEQAAAVAALDQFMAEFKPTSE